MLENINLNDKSYADILNRAVSMIPILTDEWTDYNNADPGITILQVLSLLKLAQQSYVDVVSDKVRLNLLKLMGYISEPITAPIAVASVKTSKDQVIRPNTKFYVTEVKEEALIFEPREEFFAINNAIASVVTITEGEVKDLTMVVTNDSSSNFARAFKTDAWQQELLIGLEKALPVGRFVSFYFDLVKEFEYVSLDPDGQTLCDLIWEYYAEGSWHCICVQDQTFSFSRSGFLRMKIDREMSEFGPLKLPKGFYIRARIASGKFDVAPKLKRVVLNAIELFGQDTRARSVTVQSDGKAQQVIEVKTELARHRNLVVICQEDEEYKEYRLFEKGLEPKGHYFTLGQQGGYVCVKFSEAEFGFAPRKEGAKIKVIAYNKSGVSFLSLGKIFGYDNQRVEFSFEDVMEQNLEFMLKVKGRDGESKFVECKKRSDVGEQTDLEYSLDYKNKVVIIHNSVNYSGELFATSCMVCRGKEGNIKNGELLKLSAADAEIYGELEVQNVGDVASGKNRESLTQLLKRAIWDMESLCVAVTQEDYLKLLKQTPGIEIDKINIIPAKRGSNISVVVKIKSDIPMPVLTNRHEEIFANQIERHRPIATSIEFKSPSYVAIDVAGEIFVKPSFKNAKELIHDALMQELDGVNSEVGFGKSVIYGEIYSKLENLECVEHIASLEFASSSAHARKDDNGNLILTDFSLGYLNNFRIAINTNIMTVV